MIAFTLSLRTSKARAAGVRSTIKAKVSCSPTPHKISDGRMERLLLEKRTQTRRIARIPRMPVNLSMQSSANDFEYQFPLLGRLRGNTESVFDLFRCFIDMLIARVINAAEHRTGFYFLSDFHFQ